MPNLSPIAARLDHWNRPQKVPKFHSKCQAIRVAPVVAADLDTIETVSTRLTEFRLSTGDRTTGRIGSTGTEGVGRSGKEWEGGKVGRCEGAKVTAAVVLAGRRTVGGAVSARIGGGVVC